MYSAKIPAQHQAGPMPAANRYATEVSVAMPYRMKAIEGGIRLSSAHSETISAEAKRSL